MSNGLTEGTSLCLSPWPCSENSDQLFALRHAQIAHALNSCDDGFRLSINATIEVLQAIGLHRCEELDARRDIFNKTHPAKMVELEPASRDNHLRN